MENFLLNKNEIEKIVKRLEFDASYDKVGQVYYRMKTWLQNQTTNQEAFDLGYRHGYLNKEGANPLNPFTSGSDLWAEYEKGRETWFMFEKNNRL